MNVAPRVRALLGRARRSLVVRALLFLLLSSMVAGARPAHEHLRATALLLRFADDRASGFVESYGRYDVSERTLSIEGTEGGVRARVYEPKGLAEPPSLVLAHGVHRLAIDEPRLVRFARALSSEGLRVLTPELRELADYRIDAKSTVTIGRAAAALHKQTGRKAGVVGLSFAGGLAVHAAADSRFRNDVAFVVAVGAHHDLGRVLAFFVTGTIERPDGSTETLRPHEYGPLVLVYGSIERFFAAGDVPAARDALRLWLWEQFDDAKKQLPRLSDAGRGRMEALFSGRTATIAPELSAEIERQRGRFDEVSPRAVLGRIDVPLFFLHGEGDSVIPATETLWLAHDTPKGLLRDALVSRALVHVELEKGSRYREQWELVHFMALVLDEARRAR